MKTLPKSVSAEKVEKLELAHNALHAMRLSIRPAVLLVTVAVRIELTFDVTNLYMCNHLFTHFQIFQKCLIFVKFCHFDFCSHCAVELK